MVRAALFLGHLRDGSAQVLVPHLCYPSIPLVRLVGIEPELRELSFGRGRRWLRLLSFCMFGDKLLGGSLFDGSLLRLYVWASFDFSAAAYLQRCIEGSWRRRPNNILQESHRLCSLGT